MVKFDPSLIKRGLQAPAGSYAGPFADDKGHAGCLACGMSWQTRTRWLWWPVSFGWSLNPGPSLFARWGVEVGADAIGSPVIARIWRIGRLVIRFGRLTRDEDSVCSLRAPPSAGR